MSVQVEASIFWDFGTCELTSEPVEGPETVQIH